MATIGTTPSKPLRVRAFLRDDTPAPLWIEGVTTLWFLSTYAYFPGSTQLLYLLILVFFAIFFFHRDRIIPILFRCWFLFTIPLVCALSVTWAAYPNDAMREAIFFFLSSFTVVIIGSLMTMQQILRAFFFCAVIGTGLAVTELSVIQSTQTSEYLGQKNFYAMKMLIGMISAFSVAMNKNEHAGLRLMALILVPVDFYLIMAANSATSLIMAILALFMLIFGQALWVNVKNVQGFRAIIVGVAIGSAAGGGLFAMGAFNITSLDSALGVIGKDSTFTGRTALWDQAERTSAEHPLLGVGAASFWQYDVGDAQTLSINDGKGAGTKLGFHSSYLEAQVHLGYVGLSCLVLVVAITLWKAFLGFWRDVTFEKLCFFVAALIVFSMSFTESFIFAYFHPGIYIFNLAAVSAIALGHRRRPVYVNLIPEVAPANAH